jgi:hypothetical protein
MPFHMRASLIDPSMPPSALAPLSETSNTNVFARSPVSSRNSSRRPICASACERKPAKHSMKRADTRCSVAGRSSHAGTHDGRGDKRVDGGSSPIACWRANVDSRQRSHPPSKWPR